MHDAIRASADKEYMGRGVCCPLALIRASSTRTIHTFIRLAVSSLFLLTANDTDVSMVLSKKLIQAPSVQN